MKRIISLVLSFLLLFPCVVIADTSEACYIKIGLFFGSSAKNSIKLTSDGGFVIGQGEDTYYSADITLDTTEITVSKSADGGFDVNGQVYAQKEISIKPIGEKISVDGVWYRGFIYLKRLDNSDMTVINVVDLEEYLYSVIGQEMSPSWNIEALKAQAVCARTYALRNLDTYKSYGFNLCTTQRTQVYLGIKSETERTIRAVEETRGKTVRYNGALAEVFYFSSSGGTTASSKDVWFADLPYLKSVNDIYENPSEATSSSWSVTLSAADIKSKLSARGVDIGDVTSVKVTGYGDGGIVTETTVYGTQGEYKVKKDSNRSFFGAKSQDFVITGMSGGLTDVYGSSVSSGRKILSHLGESELDVNNVSILTENGVITPSIISGDSITLTGHGWGHKVGMSQWGAKAMADKGFGFEDILKFYFTGVDIG